MMRSHEIHEKIESKLARMKTNNINSPVIIIENVEQNKNDYEETDEDL